MLLAQEKHVYHVTDREVQSEGNVVRESDKVFVLTWKTGKETYLSVYSQEHFFQVLAISWALQSCQSLHESALWVYLDS